MRKICFATGNFYTWHKDRNRLIDYVKKLDVDGVELTMGHKEELYSFKLSRANAEWLKKRHVSIHAPFRLVRNSEDEKEVEKQLRIIERLYKRLDAKNVIIHPDDLPRPAILKKFDMKISTENMPKKKGITIDHLKDILKRYRNLGLCVDVAHAYFWGKEETRRLVRTFDKKITEFHFSCTYKRKDHLSLKKATRDFAYSIQPVIEHPATLVIEENMKDMKMKQVHEEVDHIKKLLKVR